MTFRARELPLGITQMIDSGRRFTLQEILDASSVLGDVESLGSEVDNLFDPMLNEVRWFRRTEPVWMSLYEPHEIEPIVQFLLEREASTRITQMIESGRRFTLQEILDATDVPGDVESLKSDVENLFDPMLGEVREFLRTEPVWTPLYESNEIEPIVQFLLECP